MTLFQIEFIKFGLKDVIDVLVVGFIIYEVLKLVKGTRSAQIIFGMMSIAAVAFFA